MTPAQRTAHMVLAYVLGGILIMTMIHDGFGLGFVIVLTLTVANLVVPWEYARRARERGNDHG